MARMEDFDQAVRDLGIPISGINGSGPDCKINFLPEATPAQKQAARDLRASFDWVEKVALTPKQLTQRLLAADDLTFRRIVCRAVARMILQLDLREAYGDFSDPAPAVVPPVTPGGAP